METLKAAESRPTQIALQMLNELANLARGDSEQALEAEEARSGALMAICEIGKALHRGQPADRLWTAAINATERWMTMAR